MVRHGVLPAPSAGDLIGAAIPLPCGLSILHDLRSSKAGCPLWQCCGCCGKLSRTPESRSHLKRPGPVSQAAVDRGCFRVRRATKDGPPALPVILAAAAEIAAAMAYLHGRGVVHGDLAGGNVLLCSAPDAPHGFTCKVLSPLLSHQLRGR